MFLTEYWKQISKYSRCCIQKLSKKPLFHRFTRSNTTIQAHKYIFSTINCRHQTIQRILCPIIRHLTVSFNRLFQLFYHEWFDKNSSRLMRVEEFFQNCLLSLKRANFFLTGTRTYVKLAMDSCLKLTICLHATSSSLINLLEIELDDNDMRCM